MTAYAGTMTAVFLVSNTVKLALYLWLAVKSPATLVMAVLLMPAIPLGVWAGTLLHDRLDQERLYFWCYVVLAISGLKLLVDSLRALLG